MSAIVDVDGPVDGPPILFIHGTRLSRTVWRPVMRRLAGTYRVIAIDLPGHGSRADQSFTMDVAVAGVVDAVDREAGGRATLVGLSLGGYVAMETAARHPERVRALLIAGASQDPIGFWSIGFRVLGALLRWAPRGPAAALDRRFFSARYPADVARAVLDGGTWARGGAVAVRSLIGRPFAPVLAAYPGPSLILNGEFDVLFRAGARRFVGAARDGRLQVIPRATHLTNLDRPDAFAAAVRAFVRRLPESVEDRH